MLHKTARSLCNGVNAVLQSFNAVKDDVKDSVQELKDGAQQLRDVTAGTMKIAETKLRDGAKDIKVEKIWEHFNENKDCEHIKVEVFDTKHGFKKFDYILHRHSFIHCKNRTRLMRDARTESLNKYDASLGSDNEMVNQITKVINATKKIKEKAEDLEKYNNATDVVISAQQKKHEQMRRKSDNLTDKRRQIRKANDAKDNGIIDRLKECKTATAQKVAASHKKKKLRSEITAIKKSEASLKIATPEKQKTKQRKMKKQNKVVKLSPKQFHSLEDSTSADEYGVASEVSNDSSDLDMCSLVSESDNDEHMSEEV